MRKQMQISKLSEDTASANSPLQKLIAVNIGQN